MEYQCSKERFLSDVKDHKMTVLRGSQYEIYRHIRFSREGSSVYRFDLITWPGYLCITGDMGCCVFSRVEDMFDFFIMSDYDWNKKNIINPAYWEEKIQSISSFKGVKEFDADLFKKNLVSCVSSYYGVDDSNNNIKEKADCLCELDNDVFNYLDSESPEVTMQRAYDFEYESFRFDVEDFGNCHTYTFHYIWLCYAIVWGISKYKNINVKWE